MKIMEGVSVLLLLWSCHAVCGASQCLLGDFDSQVQGLLTREMLTPQEVQNITDGFQDLQNELRMRWGDAEVFVYGSLAAGLGTKTSDVDLYVRVHNYNDTADAHIVIETAKLLNNKPAKYGGVRKMIQKRIPLLTYYDVTKQRDIDITFRSDAWRGTKLISYLLQLDKRHIPLTAVIKFWGKVHHLTGPEIMSDYVLYILVIFYLQQKKMVPPVSAAQANLPPLIANKWDTNFKEIAYSVENNETIYELLGGFFKYYSEFNFEDFCVSPFAGRPIARKDFENVDTVPEEFSFYKTNVRGGNYQPLFLKTDLCIQDIFEHNANVGQRVTNVSYLKIMKHVKYAAKMYDEVPDDRLLAALRVNDKCSEKGTKAERYDTSLAI